MNCHFLAEVFGWIISTLVIAKCAYGIYHFAYTTFLGSLFRRNIDLRKCGPWAVVTGATDGIGKSYAKTIAAAGLNIVLVSRTPAKLKAVADEIKSINSSIQIKTIAVDFTEGQSIYSKLKTELNAIQIGLLINNVGMITDFGHRFDKIAEKDVEGVVNCNIMSMARMCHIVLPQMIKRKSGVIINIGSLSSACPTPLITIYGSTKAFVEKFSRDLAAEVRPLGVTIQTVHPGYVLTKMAPINEKSIIAPTSDSFVTATLRTLGLEDRTGGYWSHKIQIYFVDIINFILPRRWLEIHVIKEMEKLKISFAQNKPNIKKKK